MPTQPASTKCPTPQSAQARSNSAGRAINVVGDFWVLLIVLRCLLGVKRFDEFLAAIDIPRSLLSERLARLVKSGVLVTVPYQVRPPRNEYRLTPMGVDLTSTALMLVRWERRWHFEPDAPTHRPIHTACGKEFTPEMLCSGCNTPVEARDIESVPGPGWGFDALPQGRPQRRSVYSVALAKDIRPGLRRGIELIGDRWTSHIIAASFQGVRKFADFAHALQIATNILTDRLTRLVSNGILVRSAYQINPERYEYLLTEQGRDLFPIVVALNAWGDRWLDQGRGAPLILRHRTCGARLVSRITCNQCHGDVGYGSVTLPTEARRASLRQPKA